MKKLKLSQAEIDRLVTVERRVVEPTVFGAGRNDVEFQIKIDGVNIWQYQLWVSILRRCFSGVYKSRQPTYDEVTVCEDWVSFSNFLQWVNREVVYKGKPTGIALDKDIIVRGNKTYSPECCSFVPQPVNNLLTDRINHRGLYPVGVHFHKHASKFVAAVNYSGKVKHIGVFDTPEEAFLAYKTAKEAQIKAVANQYKDVLKPAVYDSLMNWEITP